MKTICQPRHLINDLFINNTSLNGCCEDFLLCALTTLACLIACLVPYRAWTTLIKRPLLALAGIDCHGSRIRNEQAAG